MSLGPDRADGGEHGPGAGDEDQTQTGTEEEPTSLRPRGPDAEPGEGTFEYDAERRDQ